MKVIKIRDATRTGVRLALVFFVIFCSELFVAVQCRWENANVGPLAQLEVI